MDSPALPMDIKDINVCLLSAKKTKSISSPSLRDLDQISLCDFSVQQEKPMVLRPRKRQREDELETQSMLDVSLKEPKFKKLRRPLSRMVNAFDSPLRQARKTIKRSLSFKDKEPPPPSPSSKYRIPGTPEPSTSAKKKPRARLPQNWVDTIDTDILGSFSKPEISRQEAIYSIYRTEKELVEDLKMVVKIFLHPMLQLRFLSEEDHSKIFGNIEVILSLHEDLTESLKQLRDGTCFENIGQTMLLWCRTLSAAYTDYCAHLITAKHTLEEKKQEAQVQDFLQRCLDSEFSRKLDLWSFLDAPRSRIMKYPIMLKEIQKKTPKDDADQVFLEQALTGFDSVIKQIDTSVGIAKCLDVISRLDFLHDDQHVSEIEESQFIICNGVVKNKNGMKLNAFLFDKVFFLARTTSRTSSLTYQVYRQPISVAQLVVEDVKEGETKSNGSFRGTLNRTASSGHGPKNVIKVSSSNPDVNRHAFTFQACSDYDKRMWLEAFQSVLKDHKHIITSSSSSCSISSLPETSI